MKSNRNSIIFCGALAVLLPMHASASDALYKVSLTLDNFLAWNINESGQIAGWATGGTEKAQLYTPGSGLQSLPFPTEISSSVAYEINSSGQVAGRLYYKSTYLGTRFNSFIYTPGANPTMSYSNQYAGFNTKLGDDGALHVIDAGHPAWASEGYTMAEAGGYAVGYSRNQYMSDGLAWRKNDDGTFTNIGFEFPDAESQAYGVNSSGVAVGRVIPNGRMSAFAYLPEKGAVDLFSVTASDSLAGWSYFTSAQGVTSDGRIVGWGFHDNKMASFVLTPIAAAVPEPSSYALFSIGLLALYRRARTTKQRSELPQGPLFGVISGS